MGSVAIANSDSKITGKEEGLAGFGVLILVRKETAALRDLAIVVRETQANLRYREPFRDKRKKEPDI